MKVIVAVALIATSMPVLATSAAAREGASERRVCTQVSGGRAGSRMGPRRVCRTPDEWRQALGPDWRQHLTGASGVQDDYEALRARAAPEDLNAGIQPRQGGFGPSGAAGPR
ncbi:MAG TPA: hypothetical protein VMG08_21525 [Allosphingosinicella sp.]|nr:hypothetical protein [Allosphingosinicella sp.]